MATKSLHLAYLALLLVLALTVSLSFPFSMYFFALIKSSIILFFFMHVQKTDETSRLYLFLALALLGIVVFGIWDDIGFRGYPYKLKIQKISPRLLEDVIQFFTKS